MLENKIREKVAVFNFIGCMARHVFERDRDFIAEHYGRHVR